MIQTSTQTEVVLPATVTTTALIIITKVIATTPTNATITNKISTPNRMAQSLPVGSTIIPVILVGRDRFLTPPMVYLQVHSLFEEHGKIVEVVRLKDKRTYQPHECGFVKYTTLEEADRAIGALHNKYTFPGGVAPIKVRYADGERERLGGFGTQDCKLYVGCLNKQASKREIEEIFSAYGFVESVYIVLDEVKQSRGCGFIQYSRRDMAVAAMNALGGTYIMRGCDQPLIIRFADPKKPRMGEPRPAPYLNDSRVGHTLPDASLSPSPNTMVSSSQSPGAGGKPQTVSRSSSVSELVSTAEPLDCDWSEHTCPDGYKYYYNCATCESRWEKPEDYLLFERRVPKQQPRQMQLSSHQQENPHWASVEPCLY